MLRGNLACPRGCYGETAPVEFRPNGMRGPLCGVNFAAVHLATPLCVWQYNVMVGRGSSARRVVVITSASDAASQYTSRDDVTSVHGGR